MQVSLRTATGWRTTTTDTHQCPECNQKLWIAPHGGKYCDNVHG